MYYCYLLDGDSSLRLGNNNPVSFHIMFDHIRILKPMMAKSSLNSFALQPALYIRSPAFSLDKLDALVSLRVILSGSRPNLYSNDTPTQVDGSPVINNVCYRLGV
jgi:hypothetical protein